jgi:riboflavin-specific deaminase-like protein
MDQLFPTPVDDVDPVVLYAADERPAPPNRPWVMCNMISSIDGAVAIDDVSGGLGGPADKAIFSSIRAVADVIVVASGTAIAENYRRPQTPAVVQEARVRRGQTSLPRIAIVSGSLSIDEEHRVFDPEARPLVLTHTNAPLARRAALTPVADIIDAGSDRVDLLEAMTQLGTFGARIVLLEGGPTLNGAFVDADLIDEFCLSFSPMLIGGNGARVVGSSHNAGARSMRLVRTLHQDGFLFHRYLRVR